MSEGSEDERATVEFEHTAGTLDMRAFGYRANAGDLLIGSVGSKAIGRETTMTLTEFLLARLAEDEAMAQKCAAYITPGAEIQVLLTRSEGNVSTSETVTPYDPARVLAECEAKRRIVDQYRSSVVTPGGEAYFEGWSTAMEYAIRTLALVYSDHPDCDPSWRV